MRRVLRRVGLNVLYLVPRAVGGTEVYARELIAALARIRPEAELVVFCGREAEDELAAAGWPERVELRVVPVSSALKPLRAGAELALLPRHAERAGVQLLHSLGTTSPAWGRAPRVVTVHDLIYDRFPDAFPAPSRWGLKLLVPLGARRAQRVMVPSSSARDEVVRGLGVDPARVDVVPNGLGRREGTPPTPEAELRERWHLGDAPVVVTVAAALPHKNLDRLLRAFSGLEGEPVLVVAGHAGRQTERLRSLAGELGVGERVRLTGWLSDPDLEGVYALAACFAYPSLHEGFGMPVLEAMRRGVAVTCSDATSLPEVAGEAALLFDPEDEEAIAGALRALLTDPERRRALAERGRARAEGFTWERTAELTWACYERALSESSASTARQ